MSVISIFRGFDTLYQEGARSWQVCNDAVSILSSGDKSILDMKFAAARACFGIFVAALLTSIRAQSAPAPALSAECVRFALEFSSYEPTNQLH